jgi:hypothetical protein
MAWVYAPIAFTIYALIAFYFVLPVSRPKTS